MNYKQAKKIQGIVFDLDAMNEMSTVVCAVEHEKATDEWEVYIYARKAYTYWEKKAKSIATAIFQMVDPLLAEEDNYNAGTTQDDWRPAIRLW